MLHKSVEKYVDDRKLSLYKRGIITYQQLINLIDKDDPYT